ncbi:MAG: Hpt domain-containing protein, partial [Oceanidesulfovibrio sp.]
VALTAHAMDSERKRCLDAGCEAFMAKPVRKGELLAIIARFAPEAPAAEPAPPPESRTVRVPASLEDLIPQYLESLRKDIAEMREALSAGDLESVRRLGHSQKGSAPSYGFDHVAKLGILIQDAAAGNLPDEAARLIDDLENHIRNVRIVQANGEPFTEARGSSPCA